MNRGSSRHEISPVVFAPETGRGMGKVALSQVEVAQGYVNEGPVDIDDPIKFASEFMNVMYRTDRYGHHINRMLRLRDQYIRREPINEDGRIAIETSNLTLSMDDIVAHTILNTDQTAARITRKTKQEIIPKSVMDSGIDTVNRLVDAFGNRRSHINAYLYAIDASMWEQGGRAWRKEASAKIEQLLADNSSEMEQYSANILNAAIHKTETLDDIPPDELRRILNKWALVFVDLKLRDMREQTLRHNVEGLLHKAIETIDNIENPPPNDPAAVWRDCIEAITFLSPALTALGFRDLAKDLRGVALKRLFDDKYAPGESIGAAEKQFELSDRYVENVYEDVVDIREQEFGYEDIDIVYRVKHEGSIRAKLATKDYENTYMVPDGIGFTLLMPDDMDPEAMVRFAGKFRDKLVNKWGYITNEHPNEGDSAFEAMDRENKYKAVHMTFYYHIGDEPVAFEIQVMTHKQYKDKLYGPFSDLFLKFYGKGEPGRPGDEAHLNYFEKRGAAERQLAPGVTIQSISEALSRTGERIPFVYSELFKAIDLADGQRIMVPHELEALAKQIPDLLRKKFKGIDGLAVLPPDRLSESQFEDALMMLSRDLARDPKIKQAMDLVKNSGAGQKLRKDGKSNTYEGHILPTALAAIMLAVQSGKIWESDKLSPSEYMSNIVQVALLHDHVENILDQIKDPRVMMQRRKEILREIRREYGLDVMEAVDALTIPFEIEDQRERREQYRRNIQLNGYARLIKPADRWQNHVTDLIRFLAEQPEKGSPLYKEIMEYFQKTDDHQSDDFNSPELTEVYSLVHAVIWTMAKHIGYRKARKPKKTR